MVARTTNRRLGARAPLERLHRGALVEAASRAGATLQLIEDEGARVCAGRSHRGRRSPARSIAESCTAR